MSNTNLKTNPSGPEQKVSTKDFVPGEGDAKSHLMRVLKNGKIALAQPTSAEASRLDDLGIKRPLIRSYIVWRRSNFIFAIIPIFASLILGCLDVKDTLERYDGLTKGFGKFVLIFPALAGLVLFISMVWATIMWLSLPLSMKILRRGWAASFVMSMVPAFFSLEMTFNVDMVKDFYYENVEGFDGGVEGFINTLKLMFAMNYMLTLLPVILTFPSGAMRGALRISNLMHDSALAGWVLTLSAPFYSVLTCLAMVLLVQLVGNAWLVIGMILIVTSPWILVARGQLYVGVAKENTPTQKLRIQRIAAVVAISGYFLIIIWALTTEVSGRKVLGSADDKEDFKALLAYTEGAKLLFQAIGRLLVTTIMFCDSIVTMTASDWNFQRKRRDRHGDDMDALFGELKNVTKTGTNLESPDESQQVQVDPTFTKLVGTVKHVTKNISHEIRAHQKNAALTSSGRVASSSPSKSVPRRDEELGDVSHTSFTQESHSMVAANSRSILMDTRGETSDSRGWGDCDDSHEDDVDFVVQGITPQPNDVGDDSDTWNNIEWNDALPASLPTKNQIPAATKPEPGSSKHVDHAKVEASKPIVEAPQASGAETKMPAKTGSLVSHQSTKSVNHRSSHKAEGSVYKQIIVKHQPGYILLTKKSISFFGNDGSSCVLEKMWEDIEKIRANKEGTSTCPKLCLTTTIGDKLKLDFPSRDSLEQAHAEMKSLSRHKGDGSVYHQVAVKDQPGHILLTKKSISFFSDDCGSCLFEKMWDDIESVKANKEGTSMCPKLCLKTSDGERVKLDFSSRETLESARAEMKSLQEEAHEFE